MTDKLECYVCGNSLGNQRYTIKEMMFGFRDEFVYFECQKCGCLQIASIPSDMTKYYPSSYYSYENFDQKFLVKITKGTLPYLFLFRGLANTLLDWSFRIFPEKAIHFRSVALNASMIMHCRLNRNSRILDVGCGSGILLYLLKNLGFENVMGCDPYIEKNIVYPNRLTIQKKSIEEIGGKWDLIMFNHSFEHLSNPQETLKRVQSMLDNKYSTCLINKPTTSSYAWSHYRTNWVQLDAPRHFYLQSIKSMKLLASKANLKLTKIIYSSSVLQFLGSEQYQRGIPFRSKESFFENPEKSLFSRRQIAEYARRSVGLNRSMQGDSAAFFLTLE